MDRTRYPILLNARDDEGRIVFADGRGGAYVFAPYPPGVPIPPMPTGYSFEGMAKDVPRPASMKHPFFDEHAHQYVYANEERTECLVVVRGGNPPPPPRVVPFPKDL